MTIFHVILPVIIVLVKDADLGVGVFFEDVAGVDPGLTLIGRLKADRPREMFGVAPFCRAGGEQQVRHLFLVHVFVDRGIGRGAGGIEQEQHLVALDQLAHLLDRLRRAIGVVVGKEVDLAAIDAALAVDHLEEGGLALPDRAVRGTRAAVGAGVADLDLGVGSADIVVLFGPRHAGDQHSGPAEAERDQQLSSVLVHFLLRG